MVQDDILPVASPDAVLAVTSVRAFITQTETEEADNHIVGIDDKGVILDADSVTGSRLSGNCNIPITILNLKLLGQFNGTGHIKDDDTGSLGIYCSPQRSIPAVIQVGHMQDLAAAAAGGVHSPTLGSREGPGDAILFHRRDGELLIILVRRLWSRTGLRLIVFFRGGGQGGSPGGSQFSGNTAHRERIGCSGGQRPDHGIARIDALAFLLDAAFHELPFIGSRPAHRIPLKGQRGLRGTVEDQS